MIDSDYIIEILRGRSRLKIWPSFDDVVEKSEVFVSGISILELYFGFSLMDDGSRKIQQKETLQRILKYV